MTKLKIKINYATRFVKHDRSVIRAGVEWIPLGASVQMLDPHPNMELHRKHMRTMYRIVRQSRVKLAELQKVYRRLYISLTRPAHYTQWLCIHHFEGAWNANTGNGYYGGLQMDYGFMSTYGWSLLKLKGTADRWTPLEQMQVAERAYASGRGFNPWPNTARYCGLL
jgi:hypothetical protein